MSTVLRTVHESEALHMNGEYEDLRRRVAEARKIMEGCPKGRYLPEYRRAVKVLNGPVGDYFAKRRLEGASMKRIANELGLPQSTLRRWMGLEKTPWADAREEFFPVEIGSRALRIEGLSGSLDVVASRSTDSETADQDLAESEQGAVLILPGGMRVEGVSLKDLPLILEEK
ncbi:MAG: hypothetical protein KDH09_12180 [Chrysiogenetes bacterium]|nr:hypothetical protein [Chrysiogenetes bacterium]